MIPNRTALVLLVLPTVALASVPREPVTVVVADQEPDPRKASPVGLCPGAKDLARLRSVEGKPRWEVLQTLGHPRAVQRRPDGTEVWTYPWHAVCEVTIKDGVCLRTFYTAGY